MSSVCIPCLLSLYCRKFSQVPCAFQVFSDLIFAYSMGQLTWGPRIVLSRSSWYSSPRILIQKTRWLNFTLPGRDEQPEALGGHFVLPVFLLQFVGTAAPDVYCSSWPLPCSLACCVSELPQPILGKQACLFLGLTAQALQKAVGMHMRGRLPLMGSALLPWPSLSSCTHSPSEAVRLVLWAHLPSAQHHTAFSGRRAVSQASIWLHWHCT